MVIVRFTIKPVLIAEGSGIVDAQLNVLDHEGIHIVVIVLARDVADLGTVGARIARVRSVVAWSPVILPTLGLLIFGCPISRPAPFEVLREYRCVNKGGSVERGADVKECYISGGISQSNRHADGFAWLRISVIIAASAVVYSMAVVCYSLIQAEG